MIDTTTLPLVLTPEEVANILGVSPAEAVRTIDAAGLSIFQSGRTQRVARARLLHWLEERSTDAVAPVETPQDAIREDLVGAPDVTAAKYRYAAGFVYFIQPTGGGLIKIGTAVRPRTRIDDLRRMSAVSLRILRITHGGRKLEQEAHHFFARERRHGEWFEPSPRLLAWIDGLPDQRLVEARGPAHRYRECERCGWRTEPGGRLLQYCRPCGWQQGLASKQAFVCLLCGAQVIDAEAHPIACEG
jgi:hypothetical protein